MGREQFAETLQDLEVGHWMMLDFPRLKGECSGLIVEVLMVCEKIGKAAETFRASARAKVTY